MYLVEEAAVAYVAETQHLIVEKLSFKGRYAVLPGMPHGVVVQGHVAGTHASYRLGAEREAVARYGVADKAEHLFGVGYHRFGAEQEV